MKFKDTEVENVCGFLTWVKQTRYIETKEKGADGSTQELTFECERRYYRGQARCEWQLEPGIFRGRACVAKEHDLLVKASLRLAQEISSLKGFLEKMVYFQHYGLRTRLLDVTFNPLIALYMACCEEYNNKREQNGNKMTSLDDPSNGVVYFGTNIEENNPKIAELTAKYVFQNPYQYEPVNFEDFALKNKVYSRMFKHALFIEPPINNKRLESQNGAFIMAPLIDSVNGQGIKMNNCKIDEEKFFDDHRAIIRDCNKEKILKELSILGIDGGSIYKDPQEKLKTINKEVQWEIDFPKLAI